MNIILKNEKKSLWLVMEWILLLVIPGFVYIQLESLELSTELVLFLTLATAAVVMWACNSVQEYVPAIFLLSSALFLGLAPSHLILAGFSSEVFIMVFSVLVLSVVISSSGIMTRMMLYALKFTSRHPRLFDKCFFIVYGLITPFVPSIISRVELAADSIKTFAAKWNITPTNGGFNRLVVSAFHGASAMGTIFLSASLMNFVIMAFLPLHEQLRFQFLGWFKASVVAGVIMIIGYYVLHKIFFSNRIPLSLPANQANIELKALGSMSSKEKSITAIVSIAFIGMMTYSWHRISPTWIVFCLAYVVLVANLIDRKELREKINWTLLIFLACIVGMSGMVGYFGIDKTIVREVRPYAELFGNSVYSFFIFLTISVFVLRLFLPIGGALAVLLPVFIPLGKACAINTWTVCFAILMLADCWFLPYQSFVYTAFKSVLDDGGIEFSEKKFLKFNAWMNLVRIIAVFASIYYWSEVLNII